MVNLPWRRKELLYYLDILANPQKQKQIWIDHIFPEGTVYGCLDFAIHFLFDDTALTDDPEVTIGDILENMDEVNAIRGVTDAFKIVFAEHGMQKSDEEYLASVEWQEVIKAAKIAFEKFIK